MCARARVCVCVGVTFLRDPLPQYSIIIMYLKGKAVVLKVLGVIKVLRVRRVLQPQSALRDIVRTANTDGNGRAVCALTTRCLMLVRACACTGEYGVGVPGWVCVRAWPGRGAVRGALGGRGAQHDYVWMPQL